MKQHPQGVLHLKTKCRNVAAMMSSAQLQDHFLQLGLTPDEAAQLLSVSPRTVQRWQHGIQEVPGPAEQALRAWFRLHERGLAWRPDDESIAVEEPEAMARHREHAIELDALLKRVEDRGGAAAPWQVDLDRCRATLGPLQVSFYKLRNGGFAPQSYRRSDGRQLDMQRDGPLIEDAYACIAHALAEQGSPIRTRFAFEGPSLDQGRLALWEASLMPPVVAVIPCPAFRDAFGLGPEVTEPNCRLLATSNKALLTEVAERLFAEQRYQAKDFGIRVINIDADDLKPIAARFSKSVLNGTASWGTR